MMERWDTDTPAFLLVRRLAAVRKENPAVQYGSHRTKLLSPDVYAYTRVYRDNCCLAVFNRGAETKATLEHLELPDGEHQDVLSGRKVKVAGGRIEGLELGRDSVLVLSHKGKPRPKNGLELTFLLNGFRSSYGQRVRVIGNCPELGGWDREQSFPLEYINDNMWIGHLPVKESSCKAIAYKFIVEQPDGSLLYENRPAHFRHLPKDGFLELQHRWC